ncbi:MAG: hypothetical protein KDD44_03330 [Bdellovibrionales bacterium]|nr:hypothetical protein [Bdellovibrionales bacterium]
MAPKHTRLIFCALVAAGLNRSTTPAHAVPLDCLADSQGGTIDWVVPGDAPTAQKRYVIERVIDQGVGAYRAVTLELAEPGDAAGEQTIVIRDPLAADAVCHRIHYPEEKVDDALQLLAGIGGINGDRAIGEGPGTVPVRPQSFPFIRFGSSGWVRSDLPPAAEDLVTCSVFGRTFSCRDGDRQRHGDVLKQVEHVLLRGFR